jgi:hypothetical protein
MRARIDQQRDEISNTVDQISNRVSPSHIVARRQDRMRRRLIGWKDAVFGNDEVDFPAPRGERSRFAEQPAADGRSESGIRGRAGEMASGAASAVQETPTAIRRQTRGNPMAAGAIAVAAGWLVGGLLPETGREKQVVKLVEPQLAEAASEAKSEGRELVEDLREPAMDAADHVKEAGMHAADDAKDLARQSARSVGEHAGS